MPAPISAVLMKRAGDLAGPVAAGAVVLPKGCRILYLNDSKKLSEKRREELFLEIKEKAVAWNVGLATPARIDEINILQATYEAMREAVKGLSVKPEVLLNDAVTIPGLEGVQVPIIKGDAKSLSIAAASILAKVTRDHMMAEYEELFPGYGFAKHKGYARRPTLPPSESLGPVPFTGEALSGILFRRIHMNKRQTGSRYEETAAAFLTSKGYRVLERNFRCRQGEIDLICRHGRYLVFAEVKYRSGLSMGSPAEAVDARKQERIRRAAAFYLYSHGMGGDVPCRFDVVGILGSDIELIQDAF